MLSRVLECDNYQGDELVIVVCPNLVGTEMIAPERCSFAAPSKPGSQFAIRCPDRLSLAFEPAMD